MKNYHFLIVLLFCSMSLNAQLEIERDVVSSAGESVAGDLELSWTIGELETTTYESNNVIVCLGFQQASGTLVSVSFPQVPFDVQVYPNPTSEKIHLSAMANEDFKVKLIDLSGKILLEKTILRSSNISEISLVSYPTGLYVLQLESENYPPFSFKIQKTK